MATQNLTPDQFMQTRRTASPPAADLTPDAFMANRTGDAPAPESSGGVFITAARPRGFWDRVTDVFTEGALGQLFGPQKDPVLAALDKTAAPAAQRPVLKLSELDRQGEARDVGEGVRIGLLEGLEGWTSPEGIAMMASLGKLGRLRGIGKAIAAAGGTGFDADMIANAVAEVPEAKALWEQGKQGEAARLAVRSLLTGGLGAVGAVHKGRALKRTPSLAERPLNARERAALGEQTAGMGAKRLRREARLRPPAAAAVLAEEVAARKARSVPQVETPAPAEPGPRLTRAQRRAGVKPPETGEPEAAARLADARENLARELTGKPVKDLTPDEFMVVDSSAREGYGSAKPAEVPAVAPTKAAVKPPEAPKTEATPPPVETPQPPPKREPKHQMHYGGETQIQIPGENRSYRAVYVLRHPEDTRASHNAFNFERDPEYPYRNDRDYSEPRNAERVIKQEKEYEASYLVNNNPDAVNGPPIIDAEGNVLGGNSRFMTQRRVAANRPEAAQAYREMVVKEARKFGMSPEVTRRALDQGYELHRQIVDEVPDTQKLITDLNKTGTAELTLGERAIADSKRLSQATLDNLQSRIEAHGPEGTLAQAMEGRGGVEIVNRLVEDGVVTQQEKPRLLNKDGSLTAEGKGRVSRLMVARLFEDAQQLESAAPELKQKLERAVAPLARVTGREGWDITPQVREAVRLADEARRRDVTVDDLAGQRGLFGAGEYSEEALVIARVLDRKPTEVAKAFRQYAAEADLARSDQPTLGMEPPTPADAMRAAFGNPEVVAAKARIKVRLKELATSEKGTQYFKLDPRDFQDLVVIGKDYLRQTGRNFEAWSKALVDEFGKGVRPYLLRIYTQARQEMGDEPTRPPEKMGPGRDRLVTPGLSLVERKAGGPKVVQMPAAKKKPGMFGSERGSITLLPGKPTEKAAPAGAGKKPATTAAAAAAPEKPGLTTSPSYEKTKGKILQKVDVPEAERAELAQRMTAWEAEHPERRAVTFEDIRAEARALDPTLVLHLKRPKPGETLDPALRYAAREMLNGLNEQIVKRRKELAAKQETADPTWLLDEERRIGEMEKRAQGLLDVLIPTRSQDGRNLAYHRMMAEKSFDVEYWVARAKRAAGGALDPAAEEGIRKTLAEGQEAERAAVERARGGGAEAARPAGARRNRSRVTAAPTSEQKVERGVQRTLKTIEQKARGETRQPGPGALTPEERAAVANDPRVKAARVALARQMAKVERTGVLDTISALRRAGLLTGVKTHARNVVGNLSFQVLEETARIPGVILDAGIGMFSGRRTVAGLHPRAVAKASYAAATRGLREAREIMRKGATEDELAKMDMRRELNSGSKVIDAYVNTVFRTMAAEDRVFKVYAYERSLAEQMKLAKVKAPTEAMRTQAIADALFATFNNPNLIAEGLKGAKQRLAQKGGAGRAAAFAIDMAVPFQNTPANIISRVIDYSGGGVVRGGVGAIRAAMAKALTPEQQRAISMSIGRGLTGPALIYMGWMLADAGLMTGTRPEEPGAAGREEAAGRPNGAVQVAGRWLQVAPFSPAGNLLTIGATLQRESTRPLKDEAKRPANVAKVATRTVMEQPMLKGVQDVTEGLMQPGKRMERAVGATAGSFVPTLVADAAGLTDTERRDAAADSTLGAVANAIKARVPGLRRKLPARVDALGKTEDQLWTQAFDPTLSKPARELKDPVLREMVKQQVSLNKVQRKQGEGAEEHRLRQIITGRVIEARMREVVENPEYRELPELKTGDESRKLVLERAIAKARAEVNRLVSHPEFKAMDEAGRTKFLRGLVAPD